jgi:rifampin ADP-ribosylating transferase
VEEVADWVGHPTEELQAMREGVEELRRLGAAHIED